MTSIAMAPSSSQDLRQVKASLREQMKRRVADIGPAERREATARVHERVLAHPAVTGLAPGQGVLTCLSFGSELDTWGLLEHFRDAGQPVLVPRAGRDRRLHVHPYPCPLRRLGFGLRQPTSDAPELPTERLTDRIGVVLVLGLAFDRSGRRLGYGGGYFDRFLGGVGADLPALGLAFDEQLVDALPHEPHDVAMTAVLTPSEVVGP